MLCELFIQNLAVIEKTSIQFDSGLNVFTGETGAGKSIVIDAINAVLGQRTSKEIVRHGETKASVSASFRGLNKRVTDKLVQYGYEPENGELIITREIFADSKSVARIMGRPVTVSILKEIGTELINIHGQHDNQVLLREELHIDILDQYGGFEGLASDYFDCYKNVVRIKREMKKASLSEQDKEKRVDLLTYQIKEIEDAQLKFGEDAKLDNKKSVIKNSIKVIEGLSSAYRSLWGADGDGGAVDMVKLSANSVERVSEYDDEFAEISSRLDDIGLELEAISDTLSDRLESVELNPAYLESIEERIDLIHGLKRKYGDSIEDIVGYLAKAKNELDSLELSQERLLELNEKGQLEYSRLLELAGKITSERQLAADRFVASVTEELRFLDMPSVKLTVSIEHVKPNSKGQDNVRFLISTNTGEPPKPIAKIASGGELSRIMLAIKNTLADKDEIPTLIFDEIDTGVSGRAAQKIGLKLKQAAKNRQILTVTHLAQIAALADHHFLIKKQSNEEKTFTSVTKLDYDGRVNEVARIMSTDTITDLMLENAREMINQG